MNHVVAVARTGSFTAAAAIVGLTQSAITRSIADLERQIGYSLFIRTSRGAILTEQGRDFAERAQKLIEDTKELLESPDSNNDAYSGILRIGICPASMQFALIEPIANLLAKHPSIRVEISGSSVDRTVQKLRTGALDVAVGFEAAFQDWPDLRRQRAFTVGPGLLFVRRGHPILSTPTPTLKTLCKFDFVSPSESRPYGSVIRAVYEDNGIDWRRHIHIVDFFPLVKKIVASTDAIGVMVSGYADQSASFRNKFVVLDKLSPFGTPSRMCCAIRARWDAKPPARAFMAIMHATAQAKASS